MSDTTTAITTAITLITGGGLISGIVAFRKDRREAMREDLDYTKEFRAIAQQEVRETRSELEIMGKKVKNLEIRIEDLETSVRLKDRIISLLVEYIGRLRDVLDQIKPQHPLPEVPDELKEYIK